MPALWLQKDTIELPESTQLKEEQIGNNMVKEIPTAEGNGLQVWISNVMAPIHLGSSITSTCAVVMTVINYHPSAF